MWKKIWEALKKLWEKKPKPNPEPNPDPDSGNLPDGINPSEIKWLGENVGAWDKKYSLKVSLDGDKIIYDQEGTSKWPVVMVSSVFEELSLDIIDDEMANIAATELSGNPWVIAKFNGQWKAATHEWMRPGQKIKGKVSVAGDHIKNSEFGANWKPTVGEEYGFVVTGLARGTARNVKERTQIVLFTWE